MHAVMSGTLPHDMHRVPPASRQELSILKRPCAIISAVCDAMVSPHTPVEAALFKRTYDVVHILCPGVVVV